MKSYYYLQLLKGLDICVKYIDDEDKELIRKLMSSAKSTDAKERYLHWDKLKYLELPGDFHDHKLLLSFVTSRIIFITNLSYWLSHL